MTDMSKPHIILVHGAYHRAWHLGLLQRRLEEDGYEVSALDLPAAGPDAEKLPREGGLRLDIDAIKDLMETVASKSESMIAVFHSYGGIPGGEAAAEVSDAAKKKLKRLVYMASFVIPQGTALFTPTGGKATAPWATAKDHVVWVRDPQAIPTFYQDCDPELAKEAARHVVPHAISCFQDSTAHTPWSIFPATYIFCANDKCVPVERQKMMIENNVKEELRANWETFSVDTGHSPFLADPALCANVIRKISGEDIAGLVPSRL